MLQIFSFVHACIPYCRPEHNEHTELMYGSDDETETKIRSAVLSCRAGDLIRVAEEPDAPATMDTSGSKPFSKAWLVTWREQVGDGGS